MREKEERVLIWNFSLWLLAWASQENQGREMGLWGPTQLLPLGQSKRHVNLGNPCSSPCTSCTMFWGEGMGEEPGCGPSHCLTRGWHHQADARAAGRFSGTAWTLEGPLRLSSLKQEDWPPQSCLVMGAGLAHGPGLLLPIPELHWWHFRDASLAPENKWLYQEHGSESPEGTKKNRRWVGRAGRDASYSKVWLTFLRKRYHFITLCAWQQLQQLGKMCPWEAS